MSISKKCNICSSENLQTLLYGDFSINKCNVCGFQHVPNNEKYIGNRHFENYFDKIDAKENLILNKLRLDQYKIDVEFLAKYISSESKILDVGCSSGIFSSEIYKQVQKIISGESMKSTPFWGGVMRIVISQKGLV